MNHDRVRSAHFPLTGIAVESGMRTNLSDITGHSNQRDRGPERDKKFIISVQSAPVGNKAPVKDARPKP